MTKILICDDSSLARKQLARSLPNSLNAEVDLAIHGLEAMALIRKTPYDLMFLDLTMPELDGYGVLQALNDEDLMFPVIVVSGDIQAEAQNRVKNLGALAFIQKPCTAEELETLINQLDFNANNPANESRLGTTFSHEFSEVNEIERITEIANVAMGKAASLLAQLLDVFVVLPVPKVNEVEVSELIMAVQAASKQDVSTAVCQGFVGYGISGEALLMLHDTNIQHLAEMLNYENHDEGENIEVLMDIGNILISTCLKGLEEQLDIHFNQSHPKVLGQHESIETMLARGSEQWKRTLALEFDYHIEAHNIQCTLMLLISEEAIPKLHARTAYIA